MADNAPYQINVGWAELDAHGFSVCVGWAELDVSAVDPRPVPSYNPGDSLSRYYSHSQKQYDIPLEPGDSVEAEEEEIILALLMEIATHVV